MSDHFVLSYKIVLSNGTALHVHCATDELPISEDALTDLLETEASIAMSEHGVEDGVYLDYCQLDIVPSTLNQIGTCGNTWIAVDPATSEAISLPQPTCAHAQTKLAKRTNPAHRSPVVDRLNSNNPSELARYTELQILRSGAGFYIGTLYKTPEGWYEPGSRDSLEYYGSHEEATKAFNNNSWTHRLYL